MPGVRLSAYIYIVKVVSYRAHCLTSVCALQSQFGFESMVMIGDGATDLEARQPGGADIFIG